MHFHLQIRDAVNVSERFLDFFRFRLKDMKILSVNPDDNGIACAGENFSNPFLQISLNVANESGITIHGLLNPLHRFVVVHRGINADPILGEIDAVRFVSQ